MKTFQDRLNELNACSEAKEWAKGKTAKEALEQCERGDWLLWWFFKEKNTEGYPDIKVITRAKVECARLVEHLMEDQRSKDALNVAERWSNNEATDDELRIAYAAAYAAAAYAAADAYAAYAYAAAAYAADAAATAADDAATTAAAYAADAAATAAAYAAYAAATAADDDAVAYADADAARKNTLKLCADICRKHFFLPEPAIV